MAKNNFSNMHKRTFTGILLFFLASLLLPAKAQILEPVEWSYEVLPSDNGKELDLVFKATIDEKWYLYSSDFDPELGPLVTTFSFQPNDGYELVGGIRPVGAQKGYDEIFEGEYTYFKGRAEFRQTIRLLKDNPVVGGSIEYQVCSDIDGRCINFEEDFEFKKFPKPEPAASSAAETVNEKAETPSEPDIKTEELRLAEGGEENVGTAGDKEKAAAAQDRQDIDAKSGKKEKAGSLLAFMLLAFIGGIGAVMTPCVYPMIPMTVAFFSKNTGRNRYFAFVYGLSIIFIFTVIGISITLIFGGDVWNKIATDPVVNILFFVIFFVFALSFFGLFEITLPHRLVNSIDRKADRGGLIGVFFMALTLVVVSFSCTAPIASFILIESTQGQLIRPVAGMFAFSLAFAIPFTLFAIFPGWLSNLPKSGGWLNSVKVAIGFIELALGLKFLMIADQVYHWGILNRDVYLALWIVIFTLLGFYILGKIRMPHDGKVETVSIPRLLLAIVSFSFVVYLIPGLFGAPLKQLAGFVPPYNSQNFIMGNPAEASAWRFTAGDEICEQPLYSDKFTLPYGLTGYFDYNQAVECARKLNRPLFVDFTGHGCANCWEMEEKVWSDPRVLNLLNEYVVVSLYVDDRTELPDSLWYRSSYDGKVKKTIGKQNADLQISRFDNNAQPFYALLHYDERELTEPKGYDLNVDNFVAFLREGLESFRNGLQAGPVAEN